MMFDRFTRCLRAPRPVPAEYWDDVFGASKVLSSLDARQRERIRALAQRFIHVTQFTGVRDFEPDERLVLRIAAEASVLVLEMPGGLDNYRQVHEVIVYPSHFRVDQRWTDEDGIEHQREADLAGEAWERGPVILARDDVESSVAGFNVVLHEFAHVLDACNGRVNGFPAITDASLRARWPEIFTSAYDALSRAAHRGRDLPLDPYALEDPAEFFAVATEAFFMDPVPLMTAWPHVYDALEGYYHQRTLERSESLRG